MLENSEVIALHAPKGSATMKNSEKGIGQQVYKFNFTQVRCCHGPRAWSYDLTLPSVLSGFHCRSLGHHVLNRSSSRERSVHRCKASCMGKTLWCSVMELPTLEKPTPYKATHSQTLFNHDVHTSALCKSTSSIYFKAIV